MKGPWLRRVPAAERPHEHSWDVVVIAELASIAGGQRSLVDVVHTECRGCPETGLIHTCPGALR